MRKFLYTLSLIVGMVIVYNYFNPPRSQMVLYVPRHTLERLGFNDRDLSLMLSDGSSCKHKFSKHNYVVMFGYDANWDGVRLWSRIVALYPTWQEIWQLTDEIYLCIWSKDDREPVWKGKFSLKGSLNLYLTHMRFFCNKKNNLSKWECIGYEEGNVKKEEIYKLLRKYEKKTSPK